MEDINSINLEQIVEMVSNKLEEKGYGCTDRCNIYTYMMDKNPVLAGSNSCQNILDISDSCSC